MIFIPDFLPIYERNITAAPEGEQPRIYNSPTIVSYDPQCGILLIVIIT